MQKKRNDKNNPLKARGSILIPLITLVLILNLLATNMVFILRANRHELQSIGQGYNLSLMLEWSYWLLCNQMTYQDGQVRFPQRIDFNTGQVEIIWLADQKTFLMQASDLEGGRKEERVSFSLEVPSTTAQTSRGAEASSSNSQTNTGYNPSPDQTTEMTTQELISQIHETTRESGATSP